MSSETKFTPGEWKFGMRRDRSLWLSLGDPAKGPHYQGDLVATVDDARVIVASKDLYVVLDALAVDIAVNPEALRQIDSELFSAALAVLRKARGEALPTDEFYISRARGEEPAGGADAGN